MGYTLVNLVNEYAAYKLQDSKETSSSSELWKQFDVVVKQLKKSTQSKLKQKETQTVRHRKLNKKTKNRKLCASVLDIKETSDEGWVSDNSPLDVVTEETVHSDDSDDDEIGQG
ncbi:hypothetical protein LOTGIDRAFT_176869 [Lottia gigantea]|uniref:Uncharacterized protein n=1 Tax=Lottia gigantea TaxID=225164 RepID=V3ZV09_LOTGI|nr:hypothetical protein LOTGIDRAFT_176869 [Lottia gigantea]ESO88207.1 hypothetical protein LOTGIDRAFT_176869 [Lottia gigantea]